MTRKQFIKKIKSMKRDCISSIEKECIRLFDSGAVDTEKYENDYALPKIIYATALKNIADQYQPFSSEYREEMENLSHF
jgi:hypothetical protein